MKQTAVLWLQQAMTTHLTFKQAISFDGLFQQALDMEKEQIIDAFIDGTEEPYLEHKDGRTFLVQPHNLHNIGDDYYYNHFVDANKKPDQV